MSSAVKKVLLRKGVRSLAQLCERILGENRVVRLLRELDRHWLERALFEQAPVRDGERFGKTLKDHPPPRALLERQRKEFYHLVPWLYRSNAFLDAFICEHQISEGLFLYEMCRRKRDGILVEVGRRLGGSTVVMAAALESGRLYSLDILPLDDETLGDYLKELGLRDRVEILAEASTRFRPAEGTRIDLLFLDGCKDTDEAVQSDLDHFVPLLKPGSLLLMHDYNEPPVQRAVKFLTSRGFTLLDQVGLLVCLEKQGPDVKHRARPFAAS
jgi:predicted O-methyltransferase YrrM